MRQRKFIIVKDWSGKKVELRIGYPFYHRDMLTKEDDKKNIDCYGGGKWDLDYENKTIRLYGKSDDFGEPKKKDIELAIKNLDKHFWWQLQWQCERIFEDDIPDANFDDIEEYKFIIDY